jgi:hypothetical protein
VHFAVTVIDAMGAWGRAHLDWAAEAEPAERPLPLLDARKANERLEAGDIEGSLLLGADCRAERNRGRTSSERRQTTRIEWLLTASQTLDPGATFSAATAAGVRRASQWPAGPSAMAQRSVTSTPVRSSAVTRAA